MSVGDRALEVLRAAAGYAKPAGEVLGAVGAAITVAEQVKRLTDARRRDAADRPNIGDGKLTPEEQRQVWAMLDSLRND